MRLCMPVLGANSGSFDARGAMGPTADYASLLNPHGWHIFHAGATLVHTGSGEIIGEALPKTSSAWGRNFLVFTDGRLSTILLMTIGL